jgi:transcription initiation factor IIE alpha subunit
MSKQEKEVDTVENRNRLLAELTSHIGELNAIGMAALYEAVFDRPWSNLINDTRKIRKLITILRDEGVAICSVAKSSGGGYYLAAVGSEFAQFIKRDKKRALRILRRDAKMLKTTLPNYLGQLKIEAEGKPDEAA